MPIQFYKPNPKSTGTACGVSFNSKDEAIYFSFIKQTAWNNEEKTGSFKNGEKCNVKFSLVEAGGMIGVIEQIIAPNYDITNTGAKSNVDDDFLGDSKEETSTSEKLSLESSIRHAEFSAYHDGLNQITQIKFTSYSSQKNPKGIAGIAVSISKADVKEPTKKSQFSIPFTLGEAIVLREYLRFALNHAFSAIYSFDKKKAIEASEKKQQQSGKQESDVL